ncbi:response regulator transcription factor [Balneolaceae bacterium YR4-1]|uniref:Response regulator transcription factor n=1 Tax=Halalkalibaculum roseum TaxID=2709311 RepID=A0A6M1T2Q0_9BACT|nr:LytTR family DNA-binding domain-containing protein [Halalkalibaculum roseum]NGP77047.1 response regulator transcription factor [Halalkalibaculum roseum]
MDRKIRTVIVDDEPLARKRLESLLKEDKEIELLESCANGQEAIETIEKERPDLVFLDIQMPEINGFEVLQGIDQDKVPLVVFVTAYDEYAIKAFDVHALDYIMKPFKRERFYESLDRAKKALKQDDKAKMSGKIEDLLEYLDESGGPQSRILVKSSGRYFFLKATDIDWIESSGNYVRIHSGGKNYLIRETMKNMEKKLDSDTFFRIHRSTIINVEKVKELEQWFHGDYQVIMYNDHKLTMSRNYKEILEKFS